MMEEGGEALGFKREICRLSEQAEIWLDSVDRTITERVHVDRVARYIASLEDIERQASRSLCRRGQQHAWARATECSCSHEIAS